MDKKPLPWIWVLVLLALVTFAILFMGLRDVAAGGSDCTTITPPPGVPDWRIPDCLNIRMEPATNTEFGYWKLISAVYEDEQTSGGQHHIFLRAIDLNGNHPEPVPWHVVNGGDARGLTKHPPEWADFAMYGGYAPLQGECGGYSAYMGDDRQRSDTVACMGLPYRLHINYRLIWQYQPPQPELEYRLYLPLVGKG